MYDIEKPLEDFVSTNVLYPSFIFTMGSTIPLRLKPAVNVSQRTLEMAPTMGPSLPTELCERIVDIFWDEEHLRDLEVLYDSLRSCALTCHAWLPRSRRNLYHIVLFRRATQVNQFIRTTVEKPWVNELVYELHVHMSRLHGYIPFVQHSFIQHMRNLRHLKLVAVDFKSCYPQQYIHFLHQYSIRKLTLIQCSLPITQVLQLVWSLHHLCDLYLGCEAPGRDENLTYPAMSAQELLQRRSVVCPSLEKLELAGIFVTTEGFPPIGAFGTSLAELLITGIRNEVSADILDFVPSLSKLRGLTIALYPEVDEEGSIKVEQYHTLLFTLFSAVRSHQTFSSATVTIQPGSVNREDVLDILCSIDFEPVFERSPSFKQFRIELEENSNRMSQFSRDWWQTKILARAPRLRQRLEVIIEPVNYLPWRDDLNLDTLSILRSSSRQLTSPSSLTDETDISPVPRMYLHLLDQATPSATVAKSHPQVGAKPNRTIGGAGGMIPSLNELAME